ncbi:MAG: hypothetical protein WA624_01465, partial [Methylocella sp.]
FQRLGISSDERHGPGYALSGILRLGGHQCPAARRSPATMCVADLLCRGTPSTEDKINRSREPESSDFVGEFCIALDHRWKPNELFVIFTSYFDETDTHGPSPTVILAGYVGHAYQWRQFERKLARIKEQYGFNIFHAKEFKPSITGGRSGQFYGWSDEKCDQLISDLTDMLRKTITQGITISLSNDRYLNEYRSPPIPKTMHIDSQYGACFRVCLGQLLRLMAERRNRDRMHVVFESGHKNVEGLH